MQTTSITTPIGKLGLHIHNNKLTRIDFLPDDATLQEPNDSISQEIYNQLKKYFNNPNHTFNLEIDLQGTPFQKTVWQALRTIPMGQTESYGTLAKRLKTSPRAIGNACRTNPIPVIIPCHRVVAKHHIGGFAGDTQGNRITMKQWLLQHESALTK